ncbi:MAG: hypothetical protein LBD89_08920, partial [Tannerellaceae bacterium]|nr:hypothetical protein [Tannerellaceae bacterium]
PGEWKAGEHYRYNLLIETDGKVWNYGIKSAMQEFSAPLDGNYRLEAWGGHGGRYRGDVDRPWHYDQPLGSYARGCKAMVANEKLYVCVGSKGTDKITGWGVTGVAGGTNPGGGNGGKGGNSRSNGFFPGAGGGAASDLRTAATAIPAGTNLDTNPSIDTRILVAGGAAAGGVGTDRADLATTAGFLTTAEGGTGGNGTSSTQEGSGGGGGGYRGGGGGASGRREAGRTGSSYVHPSLLTDPHIQEKVHCGDGQVRILLLPPAI